MTDGPLAEEMRRNILHVNGDDHRRLRNLVNPAFTPRAADRYRPAMRGFLDELWAAVRDEGRCEFVGAIAKPYPALTIATRVTPHVDTGDFVIVVNAEKIAVTGQKLDQKMYHRHSGYPGGLRSRTLREQLERRPTEVLRKAVKGMLPRNRLARRQITKLKIYAGPVHPHESQAPKTLEVS